MTLSQALSKDVRYSGLWNYLIESNNWNIAPDGGAIFECNSLGYYDIHKLMRDVFGNELEKDSFIEWVNMHSDFYIEQIIFVDLVSVVIKVRDRE